MKGECDEGWERGKGNIGVSRGRDHVQEAIPRIYGIISSYSPHSPNIYKEY